MEQVDDVIKDALDTIVHFIRETKQVDPTPEQLAKAMTRYFVLKEIADHIDL